MKKFIKIFIILIIILLIIFGIYKFCTSKNTKTNDEFKDLKNYLNIIYGKTYLIPEFDNINNADEAWLWDNVNQYLNGNEKFEERNNKGFDYTYNDICQIVNTLYGDNLTKKFPTGSEFLRYDTYNDKYAPTAYGVQSYFDYKIDEIKKEKNLYTVSIYDFTVSLFRTLGENPEDLIDIYNNSDFSINGDNRHSYCFCKKLK